MLAERAWSYSSHLLRESGIEPNIKGHNALSVLRIAVSYGKQLQELCAVKLLK